MMSLRSSILDAGALNLEFVSGYLNHKLKNILQLKRAFFLVIKAGKWWTLASLVLIFIQGLLPLVSLYIMKLIVDWVTLAITAENQASSFREIGFLICLAGLIALITSGCNLIGGYLKEGQIICVSDYVYDLLHAKSVAVDLEYYENPQYFDTLHRAQEEGPYRPAHIVNGLVQLGQSFISLIAVAGLLFSFYWWIPLALLTAALPGILVRFKFSATMYAWQKKRTQNERKAGYFSWILTGDEHAREIRLFNLRFYL